MEISLEQLLDMKNVSIIDLRSIYQFRLGHIPGAICIEYSKLKVNPNLFLQKDKEYYLYCDSGIRSQNLSRYLNQLGYHTVNIIGGYQNYLLRK